jgi:hypothetical protein
MAEIFFKPVLWSRSHVIFMKLELQRDTAPAPNFMFNVGELSKISQKL